ncbi:GntR family transcriptional regulator [Smaragdicoccus niigatensis]|uniref:GntR family transcriptional regulator n=1 Tax=Smaragdicoccus niigatensis TaxID=359359 RepID=UPI0003658249|nr:GntR family transcriptional regulator [Smaragdicoccus niigatensis]
MNTGPGPSRSLAAVFTPVRTVGLVDEICERIESAIESGILTGGQRLPNETELAASLGVSAMTAREALARLRARGIVTTTRGRSGGSFIADDAPALLGELQRRPSDATRIELEDLRLHLQSIAQACAAAATQRSSHADVATLRAYLQEAETDPRQWRLAETEFLLEVAAVARSARLTREMLRLQTELAALLPTPPNDPEYRAGLLDLRRAVVDAIEVHDRGAAETHIRTLVAAPIAHAIAIGSRPVAVSPESAIADIAAYFAAIEKQLDSWAQSLGPRLTPHGPSLTGTVIDRIVKPDVERLLSEDTLGLMGAGFVANVGVVGPDRTHFAWWQGTELDRADVLANISTHSQTRYLRAEWFRTPLSTGQLEITGPYVDLLCTDEYIVTFTEPVRWPHEPNIVGVAGMDFTLATLEAHTLSSLRQIGNATLINGEGRAVVSADPEVCSGDLIANLDSYQRWPAGSRFAVITH